MAILGIKYPTLIHEILFVRVLIGATAIEWSAK